MSDKKKFEAIYEGRDFSGSAEQLIRRAGFFFKESAILQVIEHCLSDFIQTSVLGLNSKAKRGSMWLTRHNASSKGQDAFYVEFSATGNDREEGFAYISCVIAEGRFLSKKLYIRLHEKVPPYVTKDYIPFLKQFFTKFGFQITTNLDELKEE